MDKRNELTRHQLGQMDAVDNAIAELITELAPERIRESILDYDGEIVGKIRDLLIDHYKAACNDWTEEDEYDFYPWIQDDNDE